MVVGKYIRGTGAASKASSQLNRVADFHRLFGSDMVGTFNVSLAEGGVFDEGFPSIIDRESKCGANGDYWLVQLRNKSGDECMAWAYRAHNTKQLGHVAEIYSKSAIPDSFKKGDIYLYFFAPWEENRKEWWALRVKGGGHKWFQDWGWLPDSAKPDRPMADSKLVWGRIRKELPQSLSGVTVLDYGCAEGYYSANAASAGAQVTGFDASHKMVGIARSICSGITPCDALIAARSSLPEGEWDYVLHLSVYHQIDPAYSDLANYIDKVKGLARKAVFLELINPPLEGGMRREGVDEVVSRCGGNKLWERKHPVRNHRSLYVFWINATD